jgi:hypothetical protein
MVNGRITRMRRVLVILAALAVFTAIALPANAVVHEQVAQYCSGRAALSPPGLSDDTKSSFAKPVSSNGVVDFPVIGDSPAAKYPVGTNIFALGAPVHPSAANCKALR